MIKIFCDHCGKETDGLHFYNLNDDDCWFYRSSDGSEKYIGSGCTICDACFKERSDLHAKLDAEFLHIKLDKEIH